MTKQTSFSELEYAGKKQQTRRDRFLSEIEAVTPWAELERMNIPFSTRVREGVTARPLGTHWAYEDAAHVRGAAMLNTSDSRTKASITVNSRLHLTRPAKN